MTECGDCGPNGPADSSPDQRSFASARSSSNNRAFGSWLSDSADGLSLVAVGLNGPFFVLHLRFVHTRSIVERAWQKHRVAAWVDQGGEVYEDFSASLDTTGWLDRNNFSLLISSRRNH